VARVQGIKEKVHAPLYDAVFVGPPTKAEARARTIAARFPDDTLAGKTGSTRLFRFFMDVQGKSKLETNLQSAGVLPSLNTFEARALRVVVSSPQKRLQLKELQPASGDSSKPSSHVTSVNEFSPGKDYEVDTADAAHVAEFANDFIFNSVTSLLVGEKVMIEMPTYWFPSGAGVFTGGGSQVVTHGQPDPLATFRFAEPVFIEPQQNFRVEILFPNDLPPSVSTAIGPLRVWVVLDGYLTRDAQ